MGLSERTVKCPICGSPYKVYAFYAGDQSACPGCVRKAEDDRKIPDIEGNLPFRNIRSNFS